MRTPWGLADNKEVIAEGIVNYTTPSHGGIKLSRERQDQMHSALRLADGWYEEDCDWARVAVNFPLYFQRPLRDGKTEADAARATLRYWFPETAKMFFEG